MPCAVGLINKHAQVKQKLEVLQDFVMWASAKTQGAAKPAKPPSTYNNAHTYSAMNELIVHGVTHSTCCWSQHRLHSMSVHNIVSVLAGEEEDLDLGKMVREGEVAWLHKADMPGSGSGSGHAKESHQQAWHGQRHNHQSPDQAAARKRKDPPASHLTYPAPRAALPHRGCTTVTVFNDHHEVRCKVTHSRRSMQFRHGSLWCLGCSPCICYLGGL